MIVLVEHDDDLFSVLAGVIMVEGDAFNEVPVAIHMPRTRIKSLFGARNVDRMQFLRVDIHRVRHECSCERDPEHCLPLPQLIPGFEAVPPQRTHFELHDTAFESVTLPSDDIYRSVLAPSLVEAHESVTWVKELGLCRLWKRGNNYCSCFVAVDFVDEALQMIALAFEQFNTGSETITRVLDVFLNRLFHIENGENPVAFVKHDTAIAQESRVINVEVLIGYCEVGKHIEVV